ncbi:hypothetical protein D3C76_1571980 [compost metagenome]
MELFVVLGRPVKLAESVVKTVASELFCAVTLKVTGRSSEAAGTKSIRAEVMIAPLGIATFWKRRPVVRFVLSLPVQVISRRGVISGDVMVPSPRYQE